MFSTKRRTFIIFMDGKEYVLNMEIEANIAAYFSSLENIDISALSEKEKKTCLESLRVVFRKLKAAPRSDWHAGFESILRIDTHKYGKRIKINTEHYLGVEEPRADYLILTEEDHLLREELLQDKEIFHIFRGHNIIEYKNPHDSLNTRTIRKIIGYANLYIGEAEHEGDIPENDVSISIFRSKRNERLFKDLYEKKKLVNGETKGIYYIVGMVDIPFQIVITSELVGEKYAAYRALNDHADQKDVEIIIENGGKANDSAVQNHYHTLVNLIGTKNPGIIEDFIRRAQGMRDVLMEIMKPYFDEKLDIAVKERVDKEVKEIQEKANETMKIKVVETTRNNLFEYVQDGDMVLEKAARRANQSVPEFIKDMELHGYRVPEIA